jgi:hypothetical protein
MPNPCLKRGESQIQGALKKIAKYDWLWNDPSMFEDIYGRLSWRICEIVVAIEDFFGISLDFYW